MSYGPGPRIGRRITTRAELDELTEAHGYDRFPFTHDFEGQGRFQVLAAKPYGERVYDDEADVWLLTVRPLCDGPPREGRAT